MESVECDGLAVLWAWYHVGRERPWAEHPHPLCPGRHPHDLPASHHLGFAPTALPLSWARKTTLSWRTDIFPPVPGWKRSGLVSSSDSAWLATQLVLLLQRNEVYRAGGLGVGCLKGGGSLGHFPHPSPDTVPWWFSSQAFFSVGFLRARLSLTVSQLPVGQLGRSHHVHQGSPVHLLHPGGQQVPRDQGCLREPRPRALLPPRRPPLVSAGKPRGDTRSQLVPNSPQWHPRALRHAESFFIFLFQFFFFFFPMRKCRKKERGLCCSPPEQWLLGFCFGGVFWHKGTRGLSHLRRYRHLSADPGVRTHLSQDWPHSHRGLLAPLQCRGEGKSTFYRFPAEPQVATLEKRGVIICTWAKASIARVS